MFVTSFFFLLCFNYLIYGSGSNVSEQLEIFTKQTQGKASFHVQTEKSILPKNGTSVAAFDPITCMRRSPATAITPLRSDLWSREFFFVNIQSIKNYIVYIKLEDVPKFETVWTEELKKFLLGCLDSLSKKIPYDNREYYFNADDKIVKDFLKILEDIANQDLTNYEAVEKRFQTNIKPHIDNLPIAAKPLFPYFFGTKIKIAIAFLGVLGLIAPLLYFYGSFKPKS